MTPTNFVVEGMRLDRAGVEALEQQLSVGSSVIAIRGQLLGYYWRNRYRDEECRKKHEEHALWFIEINPEHEIAGRGEIRLDPGTAYEKAKCIWLNHLETQQGNPTLLAHAAYFFEEHEALLSEMLYQRGQAVDASNPFWPRRLAHLYHVRAEESKQAPQFRTAFKEQERAFRLAGDADKFFNLCRLPAYALNAGESERAADYANTLLSMSEEFRSSESYGTAVNSAHVVLGIIALRKGDVAGATSNLYKSQQLLKSKPLNGLHPEARYFLTELLKAHQSECVISYLSTCLQWRQQACVLQWIKDIQGNVTPDFDA